MPPQNIPTSQESLPRFQRMSKLAKKTLHEAQGIALSRASNDIMPLHLLMAIYLERGSVGSTFLKRIGFTDTLLRSPSDPNTPPTPAHPLQKSLYFSDSTKKIIIRAYTLAESAHSPYVGTEHLAHALLQSKDADIESCLRVIKEHSSLMKTGVSEESAFPAESLPFSHFLNLPEFNLLHHPAEQENASAIDQFCINLAERASSTKSPDPHIGREKELEKLIYILGRKKKNNALLLGEPGVGKTALVSGLMHRILIGSVPESLRKTVIYELDLAAVVAGTSFRGEFEERLKALIEEASQNPHILLFIDEIHTIVGAGNGNGSLDAANILKPALARGTLRCIGATTLKEFKRHFEKDAALNRRFQTILIEEPSLKETRDILLGMVPSFESFHHVHIEKKAITATIALSARYLPEKSFPDKALDIIDSACSIKRAQQPPHTLDVSIRIMEQKLSRLLEKKQKSLEKEDYAQAEKLQKKEKSLCLQIEKLKEKKKENEQTLSITPEDVENAVAQNTEIPLEVIHANMPIRLHILHQRLLKTVIGQQKATTRIIRTLMRSSLGISQSNRPLGSFLLLGPTGVGKTLTAKTIAHSFFPKKSSFIRVDMSEFHERHTLSGLLGAPAGYVGYGEGGTLTEKIRRNPYSLVLFDEVEKAHPDILNILLQILEEGELTDAEGRKVSFSETIIILTANIGSNDLFTPSVLGFDARAENTIDKKKFRTVRNRLLRQLPDHIRPEILARLDEVLILEPLDKTDLEKIILLELRRIKKILEKKKLTLLWDTKSIALLARKSLQRNQGARPLKKILQTKIENTLTEVLLHKDPPFTMKITSSDKKTLSCEVI